MSSSLRAISSATDSPPASVRHRTDTGDIDGYRGVMTRDSMDPNRRPIPIGTDQCVLPDPFTRPTLPALPQYERFPWGPMPVQPLSMYGSAQTRAPGVANLDPL